MKKIYSWTVLLCFLLFICNLSSFAEKQVNPGNAAGSAIAIETSTGRILFQKNPFQKMYIASTTKIMTAILVIEKGNLSDVVTVSKRASMVGGSTIKLKNGEKVRLEVLLYGLMLRSGNDAAIAIAEHIAGSVENFVKMMNEKANSMGLTNTKFQSPHGLDLPEHYSSAYELAKMTQYALKIPRFSQIVSTRRIVLTNRMFNNTNDLLNGYFGADGVKTGYTSKAGRCLVASASRDGMKIISVVLNCNDRKARTAASTQILNHCFNNYKMTKLVQKQELIGEIKIVKGKVKKLGILAEKEIIMPLKLEEEGKIQFKADYPQIIEAPIQPRKNIGKLTVYLGSDILSDTALFPSGEVAKKNIYDYCFGILKEFYAIKLNN